MDNLFNNILANVSDELTLNGAIVTILIGLLFGGAISFTYYKTRDESNCRSSMAITLLMFPVILAVIIMCIGSNVARAFSLAGTLSIIRFRSSTGDAEDIGFIFFDMAAGLACGVGLYGYGALFVLVLCIFMFVVKKAKLYENKNTFKVLKITIPENLNYENAFDDILQKFTDKYTLNKIKTTDLGSLFELSYNINIRQDADTQEFINELRCRNGNLNIMLVQAPQIIK